MGRYDKSNEIAKVKRQIELSDNPDAIECLICGRRFLQVGTHVYYTHSMTAREYRKMFGLDLKRGLIKGEYRKRKSEAVFRNNTYKNLRAGKATQFKKGHTGNYERSPQTLERLKTLHKHTEAYKKKHKLETT